ncbi:MAG TPA: DUF2182 domain-containing protein [Streptosporangiaceae bacterium]|jgi:predicted metal-binding membrane protein
MTSAPAMTAARTTTPAAALTATLGLAAACWLVSVWQMTGMDMGAATRLGSFGFFIAVWVAMMAAMMLPGAAPAVARTARAGGVRAVPLFAGSYLAVWALAGAVVFAAYQPHGTAAAGAVTIAAGAYEFTPLKRHFRRRCRETAGRGFGFGLCCVGSSAGLMAMLVAGRHEHWLDGRDSRRCHRPEAPARQGRLRCAARTRDRRIGDPDHRGPLIGPRADAADVRSAPSTPSHEIERR